MVVKVPLAQGTAMALTNKPMVGKLVQPVSAPSLEEHMPTETVSATAGPLEFIKSLPGEALDKLAEGLKIDVGLMTGIATPIEPIVKAILENISARRENMSQKNRDWDDAMDLQIKMDLWLLGRGLLERAKLLDPLPPTWASRARGE